MKEQTKVKNPVSLKYILIKQCVCESLSRVQLSVTPKTIAHQTPLSMEFLRQEYWSGFSFPSPGDLPDPGIEPASLALAGGFFTIAPPGKPLCYLSYMYI